MTVINLTTSLVIRPPSVFSALRAERALHPHIQAPAPPALLECNACLHCFAFAWLFLLCKQLLVRVRVFAVRVLLRGFKCVLSQLTRPRADELRCAFLVRVQVQLPFRTFVVSLSVHVSRVFALCTCCRFVSCCGCWRLRLSLAFGLCEART